VPGGRLVIATNSGHDIQHQQPELVLDAIRDVVQAVRAGDLVPH
jgi:pimeloyl-ACP methyl ester carboxylesterase